MFDSVQQPLVANHSISWEASIPKPSVWLSTYYLDICYTYIYRQTDRDRQIDREISCLGLLDPTTTVSGSSRCSGSCRCSNFQGRMAVFQLSGF